MARLLLVWRKFPFHGQAKRPDGPSLARNREGERQRSDDRDASIRNGGRGPMPRDQGEEEGEHRPLASGARLVLVRLGEAEMGALARVVEDGEEGEAAHAEGGGDGEGGGRLHVGGDVPL